MQVELTDELPETLWLFLLCANPVGLGCSTAKNDDKQDPLNATIWIAEIALPTGKQHGESNKSPPETFPRIIGARRKEAILFDFVQFVGPFWV
jgi:hypothetical protein